MGLSTALYTGVSGLNANGTDLSVIGNDLSNSNTVGYKGGVSSFADILSSSLAGGSQIGRGVQLQGVQTDFTQGTLQTTSNPLDLAISGDGFFIVKDKSGAQFYSRSGQFSLNKDGNIVDPTGDLLQGYLTLQQGGALGTINVSSLSSAPKSSSSVTITAQLNSAQGVSNGLFTTDPTTASGKDFTITTSNNTVYVNGSAVTIPSGTYTGPGLASALQTQLNTYSQSATVTYNTTSGSNPYKFTINNGFTIDSTNDTLTFKDNSVSYTATVPHGTYATGTALATAINAAFVTAGDAVPALVLDYGVTTAGKFTFTNSNAAGTTQITAWGSSSTPKAEEFGYDFTTWPQVVATGGGTLAGAAFADSPLSVDWSNGSTWSSAATTASNMFGFSSSSGIVIDASNQSLAFYDATASKNYTATIAAGTYNSGADFAAAVQTALNSATSGGAAIGNKFTVTFDATTKLLSIKSTAANSIEINWDGVSAATLAAEGATATAGTAVASQFGFAANTTTIASGAKVTASSSPKSVGIVNGDGAGTQATATSATSDFAVAGMDPTNGSNTSDFSTSITVYDSLGNSHLINVYFKKVAQSDNLLNPSGASTTGNRWLYWVVTPGSDSINAQASISAQGMLEFDTGGKLVYDSAGLSDYSKFNFTGGVNQSQSIAFDFGKALAQGGSGLTGSTQFGSSNSVSFQDQDGYSSGSLESLNVDQTGSMSGTFTNGQTVKVAEVALARFIAPGQLTKQGSNLYGESSTSGSAIIGTAGTSGRGKIFSSSLEGSNVDLAGEFVKMIAAQQAFQSNAKIITATDTLLTALENIKQ
ncbi:MAG: flagellar hook-basal body complex protein [Nitrospirae bacterium]|nr:flagellar hook-basal body complex protein [Nitrospirota bacterium]